MNLKILALSLSLWSLGTLAAQACPSGRSTALSYIRRDNNRCEGIRRNFPVSRAPGLTSLTLRGISGSYNNTITLRVPRPSGVASSGAPDVSVRALSDRYQLDELRLVSRTDSYNFNWSTYVLREAEVDPDELRALARFIGAGTYYVPVVLGGAAPEYEFAFHTSDEARFTDFAIRCNGQTMYQTSQASFRTGEIIFNWNGRNRNGRMQPGGRCQLNYEVELESRNRTFRRQLDFEHTPDWLR